MTRSCAACGGSLDGMSSRAKYCSSTCRSRACEGRVIPLAQTGVVPVADETETEAAIVTATRDALREAGRESTPLGLATIELALALGSATTRSWTMVGGTSLHASATTASAATAWPGPMVQRRVMSATLGATGRSGHDRPITEAQLRRRRRLGVLARACEQGWSEACR